MYYKLHEIKKTWKGAWSVFDIWKRKEEKLREREGKRKEGKNEEGKRDSHIKSIQVLFPSLFSLPYNQLLTLSQ